MFMKEVLGSLMVEGDKVVVSSLDVARFFEKRHNDVLRDIRNLLEQKPELTERNFALSEYKDSTGRSLPCYLMDRDGFSLLAMGFTGAKALDFKIAFINAFNEMERSLTDVTAIIRRIIVESSERKEVRKTAMDSIKEKVKNPNYGYSTNRTYFGLFGLIKSQICTMLGLKKNANLREYLDDSCVDAINRAEKMLVDELERIEGYIGMDELVAIVEDITEYILKRLTRAGYKLEPKRVTDEYRLERNRILRKYKNELNNRNRDINLLF